MPDRRPVHLDLTKIAFPVTAVASILHRISGVAGFAAVALLLYMLGETLDSEQSFGRLRETMRSVPAKLALWTALSAVSYHTFAGIRHLLMDIGIGESLAGGRRSAKIVIALSTAAAALIAWEIW